MTLSQETQYPIDDPHSMPVEKRAELIDGQIYYLAFPSRKHQHILNYLNTEINIHIRQNGGNYLVYPAPFAVFLNENDTMHHIEPDISVICDSARLTDQGCNGAPDWIIEIVAPSTKYMDYSTKLFKYHTAGVREYWIVDPEKSRVLVYRFEKESIEEYSFAEDIPTGIYSGYTINLSSLNF